MRREPGRRTRILVLWPARDESSEKITGLRLPNDWRVGRGTRNETEQPGMFKFRAIIHEEYRNVRRVDCPIS